MNEPHGGVLVDLFVDDDKRQKLKKEVNDLKSWRLTDRQVCDLELLLNGGFSPLTGFMTEADYNSVLKDMRLEDGSLWPIPITLDVDEEFADSLKKNERIVLRDEEGVPLTVLTVESNWQPDKQREAELVYGADDSAHPAVKYLHDEASSHYLGGKIEGLQQPFHYDFLEHRYSPRELRNEFKRRGWSKIVAFQTRNPMHKAHAELAHRASKETGANLLIHPVTGMTKPGDVDHFTRVRVYRHIISRFPHSTAMMSLLPLAMRMGGPREALWHTIIRKNYGCTHFIVGRDHAGPGKNSQGEDFYGPYDAQQLVEKHEQELDITLVPFKMMTYAPRKDKYIALDELEENEEHWSISGTELRARLSDGRELPEWFTFPEVAKELRRTYPPKHEQGFTVFFTGLSGSGKSTLANALQTRLHEIGGRPITLLDGDVVRTNLSSELGFSKKDRDLNVQRIGYVASEISKNGGIALCAPIAPYDLVRKHVRRQIEGEGGAFILVHVATPLEVCERRDRKGLYAKARKGEIENFTGISDPYEEPHDAEIVVDTSEKTPDEVVQNILLFIESEGYVGLSG